MPTTVQTVNNRLLEKEFLDCPDITQKKFGHILIYQAPEARIQRFVISNVPYTCKSRQCSPQMCTSCKPNAAKKLDKRIK